MMWWHEGDLKEDDKRTRVKKKDKERKRMSSPNNRYWGRYYGSGRNSKSCIQQCFVPNSAASAIYLFVRANEIRNGIALQVICEHIKTICCNPSIIDRGSSA